MESKGDRNIGKPLMADLDEGSARRQVTGDFNHYPHHKQSDIQTEGSLYQSNHQNAAPDDANEDGSIKSERRRARMAPPGA